MFNKTITRLIAFFALVASATGCATSTAVHAPRNYLGKNERFTVAEHSTIDNRHHEYVDLSRTLNRARCAMPLLDTVADGPTPRAAPTPLSIGDVLEVSINDSDAFSAVVEIAPDGSIDLPYLAPISAANHEPNELENIIAHRLVKGGFFKRGFAVVTVEQKHAGIRRVAVSGAVFNPGVFAVNQKGADAVTSLQLDATSDGDTIATVADALQQAAGIRPDADIANIILVRNGARRVLNMTGAFTGELMENPVILSGDEIIVPSRGCFQEKLARTSAVTAPGVRIFMSNLTRPAFHNSASSIDNESSNFPYGTRLLQAVVSANCVGGAHVTNANRYVVYITRDWYTDRTIVVERPIEALVRRADRDNFNPYLQEGDALACYDSAVTNAREVMQMIGEAAAPAIFTRGLVGGF